MNEYEILRVIEFLEETRAPFRRLMPLADDEPVWNVTTYLIKHEIRGQLVTVSSLAQATGLPYATAMRLIGRMTDQGLIVRSPYGKTGKSHALHPSPTLLTSFQDYARATKALIARTVGVRNPSEDEADYYFGGGAIGVNANDPRTEADGAIRFLCSDDNYFLALRNMWADLRTNLASTRDFDLKPLPSLYDEILANAERRESRYDVITVNMPWLAELAERKAIMPLDEAIAANGIALDHFHSAIRALSHWDGQTFGVPIYSTIAILAARRDLYEERGLSYPKTFDEVIETGQRFHHPEQGRYGVVWDGARGMPIASSFLFFLGACGGPGPGRADGLDALLCRIHSDAGRETLAFMRRLLEISPPDALGRAWDENLALFLAGKSALAYCWTMRAARMEYDVHSVVKRKVEYLPQPAGPRGSRASPIGGFQLAVPANLPPSRVEAAVRAIGWMTSDEAMRAHVRNGFPIAPRFLTAAEPGAAAGSPIVRFVDTLAKRHLLTSWQRPHIPSYRAIERILGDEIFMALSGGKSDATALDDACRAIEALAVPALAVGDNPAVESDATRA